MAQRAKIRPKRAKLRPPMAKGGGRTDGWTDGRTDGHLEISPCSTGHGIGPLGPLPKNGKKEWNIDYMTYRIDGSGAVVDG